MTDQTHYEVIIVGGGLTGVMMALALSYGGYGSAAAPAIALVDRAPAQPHSVNTKTAHTESPNSTSNTRKTASGDHRTTTIHAAGKTMLDTLGVWPLISDIATPITRIKIAFSCFFENTLETFAQGSLSRRLFLICTISAL